MPMPALRTLRFLRTWLTGRDSVCARELLLDRDGTPVPATLLAPADVRGPLPSWVVLHGITRPGRAHRQLVRFTRALADGGCAVLVPEVPEWRALDLAPGLTVPTVEASLRSLADVPESNPDAPVGLLGFSFGAPQALAASAHPALRHRLAGVVGFGGYCDLERTIVFQFTGRHAYRGEEHALRPDPYGRWIVGANYLTAVPGLEDTAPVARALRRLAAEAGDVGVIAWDPRFDALKEDLRAAMAPAHREVFDLFAPPTGREPEATAAEEMAHRLAAAARLAEPGIEPTPLLADVPGPVHLLHGRRDHLIPFTELMRLRDALPQGARVRASVTRLFGHSAQDPLPGWREAPREASTFLRALSRVLSVVF